jgi:hypothetical protein
MLIWKALPFWSVVATAILVKAFFCQFFFIGKNWSSKLKGELLIAWIMENMNGFLTILFFEHWIVGSICIKKMKKKMVIKFLTEKVDIWVEAALFFSWNGSLAQT